VSPVINYKDEVNGECNGSCFQLQQFVGRGKNSWISHKGGLSFSLKVTHPHAASVVFVQYLFALAVVEALAKMVHHEDVQVTIVFLLLYR
jgi:biotin-(acetyl-CoA carboxylase) ligase